MLTYVGRRILAVVPVLFGVTLAVFSMLFLVPGDPVKIMLAEFVTTPDQIAQMRAQLHLDEPVIEQYGRFVANALRGDLGVSIRSRRPVAAEIAENAPLALLSTLQSADIVLPTTDGREIRLRRITEPSAEQKSLLQQLGLSLPEHFELNRKCSADSAIA